MNELSREYKNVVVSILQQRGAWQVIDSVQRISEPGELADMAGYAPYLTIEQKLWLLETVEVEQRLAQLIEWGREHLAELDVAERIRSDVHEGMEKSQREFLLRQQLAAIRKELGEGEPDGADDYRARVEAAELPDKVLEAALREVGRLERASDQSPEAGWIRTWLDTVLELPWRKTDLTPNLGRIDSTDDIRPGLGLDGVAHLRDFVEKGGLLITSEDTAQFAIDEGLAPGVFVNRAASVHVVGVCWARSLSIIRTRRPGVMATTSRCTVRTAWRSRLAT